jgi:hypothetical protein
MAEDLIDRIYECSFAPDGWPGVFDTLAGLAGARGGFLFTANERAVNWTASEIPRPGMTWFVQSNTASRCGVRRGISSCGAPACWC